MCFCCSVVCVGTLFWRLVWFLEVVLGFSFWGSSWFLRSLKKNREIGGGAVVRLKGSSFDCRLIMDFDAFDGRS